MSGAEAIGEAVTGGLAARAVEPQAGEGRKAQGRCLNCGTALIGAHCHECGQAANVHRTLGAFWHDFLHGALHFEGKIWRTLPMLTLHPGELTHRYVQGERARFISPIALFLFSVFLMFAVFNLIGGRAYEDRTGNGDRAAARQEVREDLLKERAKAQAELNALRQQRTRIAASGRSTANVDSRILAGQQELAIRDRALKSTAAGGAGADAGSADDLPVDIDLSDASPQLRWLDEAYKKAKQNPSLLFYKLQTNAYKFSWVLIPLSVPFVWLLFLHRRRYRLAYGAYEHLVFVTYSISFMSLAAVAFTFLKLLGLNGPAALLPLLIVPIHMYRQLRGAYRLSRWSAVWRTLALLIFASIAMGLFFALLLAVGVLG